MTITAQDVIGRARTLLIDAGGTRWTDAELLQWLTDCLRTILTIDPSQFAVVASVSLVAGTRQELPASAYVLLDAFRNLDSAGAPGRVVRLVSREVIDAVNPDWHTASSTRVVQNYVVSKDTPRIFWVYPPNDGSGHLELSYAQQVTPVLTLASVLPLDDNYMPAMVDYVVSRAFSKDGDFAGDRQLSVSYMTSFAQFLGVAVQAVARADVSSALGPGDKGRPAAPAGGTQ